MSSDYQLRGGRQPDVAAITNVLAHQGVHRTDGEPISEALLFTVSGGIGAGYILWEFAHDATSALVLGFRARWQYPQEWLKSTLDRLGLEADVHMTGGKRGAAKRLTAELAARNPVIVLPDRYTLGYWHLPKSADGGGGHFAAVIRAIRAQCPSTTIEVLTPDFLRKTGAVEMVVAAKPDVFNHNLETVPSKYLTVRPGARYFASIRLLQQAKEIDPTIFTKSGIMVGLGEGRNELLQVMDDLRAADVDFLTIGQYLQPTRKHHAVERYVHPDEFKAYETIAYAKGFLMVSSSPLTRSSHHAGEDFARLKAAREAKLGGV